MSTYRKRNYRKKTHKKGNLNKRVSKLEKEVGAIEKGEDTELQLISVTTTPSVTDIGTVAQGDDKENRKGDHITIDQVYGRFLIYRHASAASGTSDFVRVIVLFDRQANGAVPAYTDVVQSNNIMAYRVTSQSGRFKVLFDKMVHLNAGEASRILEFYRKNLNERVSYTGTSGAITDISKGSLILIQWSNQTTTVPDVNSNIRFRFSD